MARLPTNRLSSGAVRLALRAGLHAAGAVSSLLLIAYSAHAAAPPQAPKRIDATERVQVNLVLIDIVVRDRKDQPVRSLTRDDFELRIDGVAADPSDIESFEELCGGAAPAQPTARSAVSPETAPAGTPPAGSSGAPRHIVLYFDFSHMSMSGARSALRGAREQVASHPELADRLMILAYKNGLRLVQDFTADTELLLSRIDAMLADSATVETDVMEEDANAVEVEETPCADPACSFRQAAASARAIREEMRGRRSLEALTNLMPALAGLKGRKAVVLFTEAMRQEPGAEYFVFTPATPREAGISLEREMLRLTSEANAASVSIYTAYAGGLTADESRTDVIGISHMAGNNSARALQTTLAVETGGKALQRSNDLGGIIQSASRDLSCYYLLGYRYQGRGDNKRHNVVVKLKRDREITRGPGLTVRHRPYYNDQSADDRRDRLVQSALLTPALFHDIPVEAEAYALAPARTGSAAGVGRRVLVKVMVPMAALPLLPAGDAWLEGRVTLRGVVTNKDGKQVCELHHEMPLRVPRDEAVAGRLVFETGCVLEPEVYSLSLIALDPATLEIGAHVAPLIVVKPDVTAGGYISEFYLWTREPGALLVTSGLKSIGVPDGVSTRGLIPRPERRMDGTRDAALTFMVCLPSSARGFAGEPLHVSRALRGDGDAMVSDFGDMTISDPLDPETGCFQVSTAIPGGTLGAGIYKFLVEASGASLKAPVKREAELAVDPAK